MADSTAPARALIAIKVRTRTFKEKKRGVSLLAAAA
jgi:hypothetical protein